MPRTILAIDPGLTVGWCLMTPRGEVVDTGQFKAMKLMSGQEEKQDEDTYKFHQLFSGLQVPSDMIVEDFIGSGRRDPAITNTIKILGYILAMAHNRFIKTHLQVPQTRRPFLAQAEKALSQSKAGARRHSVDAAAHCFAWLFRNKNLA